MSRPSVASRSAPIPRLPGRFVVLVGPDGAGKTTVARALTQQYDGPTAYFHFRPPLFRGLASAPPDVADVPIPKATGGGSRVIGWLRLVRTVVHCRLAYLVRVRPALRAGTLVIADRWAYGYLVHPRALRFHGPAWLATLAVRALPRPHVIANLRASAALIHERKRELSPGELDAELDAWSGLPDPRLRTFDAGESPATVARHIVRELWDMTLMSEQYKNFPPGRQYVRIPTSSRRAALVGLSLYPSCKPRALWGQRAAWMAVALLGPRALLGRAVPWRPSLDDDVWAELSEMWSGRLGPFDSMAAFERRQASRPGLALLLLRRGRPVAFVKLRASGAESLCDEANAHGAAWRARPRSFSVPEPLFTGTSRGWDYFATAPLRGRIHSPPRNPPLDVILPEIEDALGALPRPPGTPVHWRPMHGDFTPWNLRRVGREALVLVDWERAGWGPPCADRVLYAATEAVLGGAGPTVPGGMEAIRFWRSRVASWPASDLDHDFTRVLLQRLHVMEQRA